MAKNENSSERNLVFMSSVKDLEFLDFLGYGKDPVKIDTFRKELRSYSDELLTMFILATHSKNTALAWIMRNKYGMSYSGIARQIGVVDKTVFDAIDNLKDKIDKMKADEIIEIQTTAYELYKKEIEFKRKPKDKDCDFLISIINEQLRDSKVSDEDKIELRKKLKELCEN